MAMTRTPLVERNCPIARASEVIGDRWCLLILRDALEGIETFSAFRARSGIAPNVLKLRLDRLIDAGVIKKTDVEHTETRHRYVLTPSGRDLMVVFAALQQWGDRWAFNSNGPVQIIDKRTGTPIPNIEITDGNGDRIARRDIAIVRDADYQFD